MNEFLNLLVFAKTSGSGNYLADLNQLLLAGYAYRAINSASTY